MPQAPLPAPAARIQVPSLISPMVGITPNPPNLPAQLLPDVMARVKEGAEAGLMMAKLPKEVAENRAQKLLADISSDHAKMVKQQYATAMKGINPYTNKPFQDNGEKIAVFNQLKIDSGISMGEGGGSSMSPTMAPNVYGPQNYRMGVQRGITVDQPQGNQPQGNQPQGNQPKGNQPKTNQEESAIDKQIISANPDLTINDNTAGGSNSGTNTALVTTNGTVTPNPVVFARPNYNNYGLVNAPAMA
jgi:hypothetical protein